MKMQKHTDVDSYIAAAPEDIRDRLVELRAAILNAAPRAKRGVGWTVVAGG